jgi:hypothetical protein
MIEKLVKNENQKFQHLFSSYPVKPVFTNKYPYEYRESKPFFNKKKERVPAEKDQEYFIKIPKHLTPHE